jgi:hypothetical protein
MDPTGISRRLLDALDALDARGASRPDRLLNAVSIVVPLRVEDLPAAVRQDFEALMADMKLIPNKQAGALRATLDTLSSQKVLDLAKRLRQILESALALALHTPAAPH